ncbi:hypothetical protein EDB85DRAFT_1886743 [Lactarius pseudohatsudake]|nr:hypothetical protein EDB85DRAFT_1886743 [Lactarius pseudohatsudake]
MTAEGKAQSNTPRASSLDICGCNKELRGKRGGCVDDIERDEMDAHLLTSINGARHARDGSRQRPGSVTKVGEGSNKQPPTKVTRQHVEVAREGRCMESVVKKIADTKKGWSGKCTCPLRQPDGPSRLLAKGAMQKW